MIYNTKYYIKANNIKEESFLAFENQLVGYNKTHLVYRIYMDIVNIVPYI